jgi:hypothetical protein
VGYDLREDADAGLLPLEPADEGRLLALALAEDGLELWGEMWGLLSGELQTTTRFS